MQKDSIKRSAYIQWFVEDWTDFVVHVKRSKQASRSHKETKRLKNPKKQEGYYDLLRMIIVHEPQG